MLNRKKVFSLSLLMLFILGVVAHSSAFDPATFDRYLDEEVQLGTYYVTLVDYATTKTDYLIVGENVFFPAGEYISAGDGNTAVATGTSYVDLSKSCILGDYASDIATWADFAFLQKSYSTTEVETGDTACGAGNITDPSLSAGQTTTYISAIADFTDASADGGTDIETVSWTANIFNDIDGDGTDDTATVPEEDYIPCTKDVYIYFSGMIDSSDVDTSTFLTVYVSFYIDQSTNYNVEIRLAGGDGDASAYSTHWTYAGVGSARLTVYEAEDDAFATVISLAELISDDANDDPSIAGIDYVKIMLHADDNYGSGDADTVKGYVYNLALFDEPPAITDNTPSTDIDDDLTGGESNTVEGDATYLSSHNILNPYWVAAATNSISSLVYLDTDVYHGMTLTNAWHQIYFAGTACLMPESYGNSPGVADGGNYRSTGMTFNFNPRQISDPDWMKELSSTWVASYSTAALYITTDEDQFNGDPKEFHLDVIEANVEGVDETDAFVSALVNQGDDTDVSLYAWSTAPTAGIQEILFKYYNTVGAGWSIGGIVGFVSGNLLLFGIAAAVLIFLRMRKK